MWTKQTPCLIIGLHVKTWYNALMPTTCCHKDLPQSKSIKGEANWGMGTWTCTLSTSWNWLKMHLKATHRVQGTLQTCQFIHKAFHPGVHAQFLVHFLLSLPFSVPSICPPQGKVPDSLLYTEFLFTEGIYCVKHYVRQFRDLSHINLTVEH